MTRTLTIAEVEGAIEKIEHMFPADYRYAEPRQHWADPAVVCQYGYDLEHPGCIIGWILWFIDKELFQSVYTENNHASLRALVVSYHLFEVEGGSHGVLMRAMSAMQGSQDACRTWGEAIAEFHAALAEPSRLAGV